MPEVSSRSDYGLVQVSLHGSHEDLTAIWRFPDGKTRTVTIGGTDIDDWTRFATVYEARTRGVGVEAAAAPLDCLSLNTIGERIFERLVPHRCQDDLREQFATPGGRHLMQPVRIEVTVAQDENESPAEYVSRIVKLGAIPWETMRTQPTTLAGVSESLVLGDKVSIVRRVNPIGSLETGSLDVADNVRVVVFVSEPCDLPTEHQLPSAASEVASIRECVAASGVRIEPLVVGKYGQYKATWKTLTSLVGDDQVPFHVFHFIGHGEARPGSTTVDLLFEDEHGNSDWRDFSSIANELMRSQARLLVLNGCKTAAISALAAQFSAVVGMQFHVCDEAAQLFAAGFYRQLAENGQLDDAVWMGRRSILEGSPTARADYRHPVLYLQSPDGLLLRIPPRIQETALPEGRLQRPYNAQFTVRGGRGPHTWDGQNLHEGLEIGGATGRVTGCPSEAGKRIVTIRARSHDGLSHEVRVPLEIQAKDENGDELKILTDAIGCAGDFLDQVLMVSGGKGPYTWTVEGLPEGFQFRPWGAVYGTIASISLDDAKVSLTVRDRRGHTDTREVPLRVEDPKTAALHAGLTRLQEEEYAVFREPEIVGRAQFCLIRGGAFHVGYHPSDDREQHLSNLHREGYAISPKLSTSEFPPSTVHVDGFLIQRYEVSNAQFAEFIRETGHRPAGWSMAESSAEHPAVDVSFEDALDYCKYKTEKAAANGLSLVYRLPTHWEWEKAAKGAPEVNMDDGARIYPWGDAWGNGMLHDMHCHSNGPADVNSHPGARSSSGVCDLAGNVSEWIDGGEIESGMVFKHIRGASWRKAGQRYALTFFFRQELVDPAMSQDDLGFRCVLELPGRSIPQQAFVRLGNDQFVDGEGQRQFIGGFLMARFAVTNEEYAEFRPEHKEKCDARFASHPVTGVSHQDATDFCKWKTQREGRTFWLPTRAEWERAYRGTGARRYSWGDEYSRYRCNSLESGWGRTVAVWDLWQGATPEGIYNLCGNTFEWTREGESLGGSWCSTCETYGDEPYQPASVHLEGREDVGFRYVTY